MAEGKDGALFRPREGEEKRCDTFGVAGGVGPPSPVIEANEDDGVVFKSLALMDGHHRNLINPLERIEAGRPVRGAIGRSEEMDAKSFKDDLKQVANAIFGISSGD